MTDVYRLVRAERADDALSGEGARLHGGRWNPAGWPVLYASESRALAVLETFVHLTLEARFMRFLLYQITLPRRAALRRHAEPPAPAPRLTSTQDAGREWLEEGKALAFIVPSVIVPQETNYVIDVRHRHFRKLHVAPPEPFSFDERLWQRRLPG